MVRPIGLFDIPLIHKLQSQGMQLDPSRALTRPESPLGVALRAPLSLHSTTAYTYLGQIDKPAQRTGFVQLRQRDSERPEADVTYIAPTLDDDVSTGQLWANMLEVACFEAGDMGVQRIFASLPADCEESAPFLSSGFIIFSREEVLECKQLRPGPPSSEAPLRPQEDLDSWALQRLQSAVVPLGVKQAEGLCELNGTHGGAALRNHRSGKNGYVLERKGDLVGHVEIVRGTIGHWIRFTLHPDAGEFATMLVDAGLQQLHAANERPIYCPIRTYESVMKPVLLRRGFEVIGRRDLLVRHTLARIHQPAQAGMRVLEPRTEVSATRSLSPVNHLARLERDGSGSRCPEQQVKVRS